MFRGLAGTTSWLSCRRARCHEQQKCAANFHAGAQATAACKLFRCHCFFPASASSSVAPAPWAAKAQCSFCTCHSIAAAGSCIRINSGGQCTGAVSPVREWRELPEEWGKCGGRKRGGRRRQQVIHEYFPSRMSTKTTLRRHIYIYLYTVSFRDIKTGR